MAGGTQDGWASGEACLGTCDRLLTRLGHKLGSCGHESPVFLKLACTSAVPTSMRSTVTRQAASMTPTVEMVEARPVRVRIGCGKHADQAAGRASDLQASDGRGRSRRPRGRRRAEKLGKILSVKGLMATWVRSLLRPPLGEAYCSD